MATQPDFWGNLELPELTTPAGILRKQAALLGQKTNYVVVAKVETNASDGSFRHSFNLVVPVLDDYTYQLFRVRHDVDLYPVRIEGSGKMLKTEDEFSDWVRQTLSSANTKRIIGNLVAQATS